MSRFPHLSLCQCVATALVLFQDECTVCDVRQRQSVRILQYFSETRRVSSPGHYCKRPAEGDRSALDSRLSRIGSRWHRCVPRLLLLPPQPPLLDLKFVESQSKISFAGIHATDGVFAVVFRD